MYGTCVRFSRQKEADGGWKEEETAREEAPEEQKEKAEEEKRPRKSKRKQKEPQKKRQKKGEMALVSDTTGAQLPSGQDAMQ